MLTDLEIQLELGRIQHIYGVAFARRLEQLYRNETNHFKSGNFKITFAPGMEAFGEKEPWGWVQLAKFWQDNPHFKPIELFKQVENSSALAEAKKAPKTFLVFPDLTASMMSVAYLIKLRGSNFGTYFSKNPTQIAAYNKVLDSIIPRFVK